MSRSGVTYSEVANAARELEGRGINPTVDGIRELLRTGSRSTLGPLLKKWKSEQEEGSAGQIQAGLPQELSSLVKGLYERLQREANIKIEEIEQSAKNEIEYIQSKLDQTVARNTNLENELQNLKHKLLDALSLSEQYYKDLKEEQKKSEILLTKSQELETRSEDRAQQILVLEKQLHHTQTNLEHFRETTEKFSTLMENRTQVLLEEKTTLLKENEELKRKLKMQSLFD